MTKKTTIIISILLIVAGIIIEILLKDSQIKLDTDLVGFLAGLLIGAGIVLPLNIFAKKKNIQTNCEK